MEISALTYKLRSKLFYWALTIFQYCLLVKIKKGGKQSMYVFRNGSLEVRQNVQPDDLVKEIIMAINSNQMDADEIEVYKKALIKRSAEFKSYFDQAIQRNDILNLIWLRVQNIDSLQKLPIDQIIKIQVGDSQIDKFPEEVIKESLGVIAALIGDNEWICHYAIYAAGDDVRVDSLSPLSLWSLDVQYQIHKSLNIQGKTLKLV